MTKVDGTIFEMCDADIEEKINQYLAVREAEKNKFGEVFTPMNLINEMLSRLPSDVWSNPDLKWLDPANGIGNFPMVVYQRLMKGLEQWEPNQKKRSQHIIENMLYMVEINSKNVEISQQIFGSNANIFCADLLARDFGENKFDIIIGNPPFNREKNKNNKKTTSIWPDFVKKSLDLLVPNGYLGFITPASWRRPDAKLFDVMTRQNQLLYLHIYGEKQGQKNFKVLQRIDLYVIQKRKQFTLTEIIDELGNEIQIDVSKWDFIPNYEFEAIRKIMTTKEDGLDIIFDTTYHTQKSHIKSKSSDKYKYPIVHSINQEGLLFWYTDDNTKGHFGVPKVLLNFNRHQYPVNDYEGKYGMSQITFGIPITSQKQGDEIIEAINTDAFKNIIKATKWGAFQTDYRMFKYFKPDFYKQFPRNLSHKATAFS